MKKGYIEKEKKSYHELIEEQDSKKDVFKRSLLPRKKPVAVIEEVEKPKYGSKTSDSKNKGYLPKDLDKDEKTFRRFDQNSKDRKPYASNPRQNQGDDRKTFHPKGKLDQTRPYSPNKKFFNPNKTP